MELLVESIRFTSETQFNQGTCPGNQNLYIVSLRPVYDFLLLYVIGELTLDLVFEKGSHYVDLTDLELAM